MSSPYFWLGVVYIFGARVSKFAVVHTSIAALFFQRERFRVQFSKTQASSRLKTSTPKYNDDITENRKYAVKSPQEPTKRPTL
jgi:hypothetical protein